MPRTQKDAGGKDVRTDTPAYGCQTVEHAKPPAKTTTTKKPAADPAPARDEGDE